MYKITLDYISNGHILRLRSNANRWDDLYILFRANKSLYLEYLGGGGPVVEEPYPFQGMGDELSNISPTYDTEGNESFIRIA